MLLFDFSKPETVESWSPVDDVVMGGMSFSRLEVGEQTARFTGEVSLENNGGFASVSSPSLSLDLGDAEGLSLRIRGDGKRYGVTLRCGAIPRIRYQIDFYTEPEVWETIHLPFSRFRPKRLGAYIWGAPPFDPQDVSTCGLIISDKQAGAFTLEVAWIASYPVE